MGQMYPKESTSRKLCDMKHAILSIDTPSYLMQRTQILHTNTYYVYYYKITLNVSTLEESSSGAKSNKLTTYIQRSISSQTSDNNDTIVWM
jgi:hypothetical protein